MSIATEAKSLQEIIRIRHQKACKEQQELYEDPVSGYMVFSEYGLRKRGKCCSSGCRHCPYEIKKTTSRIEERIEIKRYFSSALSDILFWSGGKDSYLALNQWLSSHSVDCRKSLLLFTTYDWTSKSVAHQDLPVDIVRNQARNLKLSSLRLGLTNDSSYSEQVAECLRWLSSQGDQPEHLIFGDLHLEHIRRWREENSLFTSYKLEFPLWKRPYDQLMRQLEETGATCKVSAVDNRFASFLEVGETFNRGTYERLKHKPLDAFGENGEFHTLVEL